MAQRNGNNGNGKRHQSRAERTLIVIGGHEDKQGCMTILREVASHIGKGKVVVTGVASREPRETFRDYARIFKELGVGEVVELDVPNRSAAMNKGYSEVMDGVNGVFVTGGDQLR